MNRIQITLLATLFLAAFGANAQQVEKDSTNNQEPAIESRHQPAISDGIIHSDTDSTGAETEADTTSTRTFGTAPGTGTTGAGSGNGDAAGNTGTPGSDTMKEEKDTDPNAPEPETR
jgi:hypothetical protein